MLNSNEFIAMTQQAEMLRQAKQQRLVREAQSNSNSQYTHFYARLATASRGLLATLTRHNSSRKTSAKQIARHAR